MSRRNAAILAVLCGVLFLDGLDISLAGVALPSIKRELGLDDSQASSDPVDSVPRVAIGERGETRWT
jgi:hypothetical protein